MDASAIVGIIAAVIGFGSLIVSIIVLSKNKKADDKHDGEKDGVVLTELGYIKKGIDGIESRLEKQENKYVDIVAQLTEVKVSTKQAHKRIDDLEQYHKPKS